MLGRSVFSPLVVRHLLTLVIIDEVSVYGKALSTDEVERNYTQPGGLAVNSAGKTALTWGAIKASN